MLKESKLRDSLKGMCQTLSCPVTVKIRTGWDENKPIAHKLVPKIQKWGFGNVSAVMVSVFQEATVRPLFVSHLIQT
jgi:tRNA-dihydrouridine synthase 3